MTGKIDVRDIKVPELEEESIITDLEENPEIEEISDDASFNNDL